jgi:hypothetical protein
LSRSGLGENARELPRDDSGPVGVDGASLLNVGVENPIPPVLRSDVFLPLGDCDRDGVPSSGKIRCASESSADGRGGELDREADS